MSVSNFVRDHLALARLAVTSRRAQEVPFSTPNSTGVDNCVLANGIPKSGTHLLYRTMELLGKWTDVGWHINLYHADKYIDGDRFTMIPGLAKYMVQKLRNGQFVTAHLPWSRGLVRSISQDHPDRRIKHILIFRDPRDTFISYFNMAMQADYFVLTPEGQAARRFLREEFADDDERLAYVIHKRRKGFLAYAPWLADPNCYSLRFEDAYQEIIFARETGVLGETLKDLFHFVGVNPAEIAPSQLGLDVAGQSRTATDEEDKIGQFRRHFKDQHYALLDNRRFRRGLEIFGYDW